MGPEVATTSMLEPGRGRRLLAAAVGLAAVWLATAASPAAAHPFGPPPTAQVAAAGRDIIIDWSATPDDAVAIGELLGVMPPGSVELYRQEAAAQAAPSAEDEARLSASPKLHDYLLQHIAATQNGEPCEGSVPAIPDFVHVGARVVLTCPEPVAEAELRITMLHDIHDAYRTFAAGTMTDPADAVFTVAAPQHTWRFGVEPAGRSLTPRVLVALLVAVVALSIAVVAGAAHWRGRRRA